MKQASATATALVLVVLVAGAVLALPPSRSAPQAPFPHDRHAKVFPVCTTCHEGIVERGAALFPDPVACASCHDGVVQPRVSWTPSAQSRVTNLRFTHASHASAAALKNPADSGLIRNCSACHVPAGSAAMSVQRAVVGQCLTCHGIAGTHVDVDRNACATCHVRLTDSPTLTRAAIARFPRPASHSTPDFVQGGHGRQARLDGTPAGSAAIAASCATCHARNLCLTCHVNAPESAEIRALALDGRPPVFATKQPVPTDHAASTFVRTHGPSARAKTATCATCHTQQSCLTCHVGAPPRAIAALAFAGEGRAAGAQLTRRPPKTHTAEFREGHGPEANARPATCESCHERSTCLSCHRPDGARQQGYHPQNFLTRHPSSAYARSSNCSDCHNPAQFCQRCHQQSGLTANARLGSAGYHDAFRGFSLGHGQAARQSLESCASCHAERDCTTCHSAVNGGYRFNPHGPGFNAARAQAKNPSMCIACHGRAIPSR